MPEMRKVVLDTNFIMIPGQIGVDIFQELQNRLPFPYKLCILSGTIAELDKIIEKDKNEDKIAARIAKALIPKKEIEVIESKSDVDSDLVELSRDPEFIIATQDTELKRKLPGKKIILRQKKFIELI